MTGYQRLTIATVVATLVLIAVGSLVRTTGSGLGCPDWPLCHGRLVPPAERTAIIEWTHRTVASGVGVLILWTALATLRRVPRDQTARRLALLSVPLLALQAWLGKETVERELPPEVVAIHLSTALVLLAVLTMIATFAVLSVDRDVAVAPDSRALFRVGLVAVAIIGAVLVLGSYVVGSDAGFACSDWPGCRQAPVPFFDGLRLQHIQWLHRLTVLVGFAASAVFAYLLIEAGRNRRSLWLAGWLLVGLYAIQIGIGALIPWTDFSEAARVTHLAVASAIWGLLTVVVLAVRYRRDSSDPRARTAGNRPVLSSS